MENSGFFHISNFTWNQFWRLYKCKICHFNTFRGSEFWFYQFLQFLKAVGYHINQIHSPTQMAVLESLHSPKLISRKIDRIILKFPHRVGKYLISSYKQMIKEECLAWHLNRDLHLKESNYFNLFARRHHQAVAFFQTDDDE